MNKLINILINRSIYLFLGFFLLFSIGLEYNADFRIWFRLFIAGMLLYTAGLIEGVD